MATNAEIKDCLENIREETQALDRLGDALIRSEMLSAQEYAATMTTLARALGELSGLRTIRDIQRRPMLRGDRPS